jgi:hypothetical protein
MEHSPTELDLLKAELAELRHEVAALKDRRPPSAIANADADGDSDVAGEDPGASRRGFLRLAGAAAVGATAAALASSSEPAAAITGGNMLIGQSNTATATNDTTVLFSPSAANLDDQTFMVQNFSLGAIAPPADHRVSVAGMTSGADGTNGVRTGVYGRTSSPALLGGQGVFGGAGGSVDNPFASAFNFGVVGTGPADGYGVFGYNPVGTGAVGVLGRADQGIGVIASSSTGLSLLVRDGGRIQQQLRANGAPAVGSFSIGEMIRDGLGDMYICTASGTPGTWRKVTAQHPEFAGAGGSINLLAHPIRLIDSRGLGAPITNGIVKFAPGAVLSAQVTGTVADLLSVPAGAKGILGNLTATEAAGNGFALVWPTGQPQPSTSNINFSLASNPAIANYFISALDTAGKMNVMTSAAASHLIVDVFGFVF